MLHQTDTTMKQFIESLNEYHTLLAEITIYDGYTLDVTQVDSINSGITYYEVSSGNLPPRPYETLEAAMEYINNWVAEVN